MMDVGSDEMEPMWFQFSDRSLFRRLVTTAGNCVAHLASV